MLHWLTRILGMASLLVGSLATSVQACPQGCTANAQLEAHSEEFEKRIYPVTDGVWVAVGYGIANSILVEGDDGVIVIDTLESEDRAAPVKEAFDALVPNKPVKAIIYTHNHADHCFGARTFAGEDDPLVISHASTMKEFENILNVVKPIVFTRSMRQFGCYIPSELLVNDGIGPAFFLRPGSEAGLLLPNATFAGEVWELHIAGIELVLVHAPGETDDQIFVWIPEKQVLCPGDNFYKAFPNLYAIRGTRKRDVVAWVSSLDKMREYPIQHLVPSHTRPISGQDEIYTRLTNYRDAIQFVHDQTVYWMNAGLHPDQIVQMVKLPQHLAQDPYLQEYYGKVCWSVRSIFDSYLGWFSGKARELYPLGCEERAQRLARMTGGIDALVQEMERAREDQDTQWALELADMILQLDSRRDEAIQGKIAALHAMAQTEVSANGRNYLLSEAFELEGKIEIPFLGRETLTDVLLQAMPMHSLLDALKVNINPESTDGVDLSLGLVFTDLKRAYTLQVRSQILEVQATLRSDVDLLLELDSQTFKRILGGYQPQSVLCDESVAQVQGDLSVLAHFLSLF